MSNVTRTWIFGLLLSGSLVATGQEGEIFAFFYNDAGRAALRPATAYKYEVARGVFEDLLRARGDSRQQAPTFVMNDGERYMAWMDPKKVVIGMEEKTYDVCVGFGPDSLNALAALLAHELIHHYEKHDWGRNFAHARRGLEAASNIRNFEGVKQETQADYLGGFLAFSAGYPAYGLMPQLLERLYAAYGLPPVLTGYPALEERVKISQNAMRELRDLQTVFEVGQQLSVLENHEAAALYYRHILKQFQSREIYNNAGLNSALAALPFYSLVEMPYVLPLELDPHSRLHNLKSTQAEQRRLRQQLLQDALGHFDRALALDPGYTLAYLNKACVLALAGELEDAAFWLRKGRQTAEADLAADFLCLEGILAALQQDTTAARAKLMAANRQGSPIAAINLLVLDGQPRSRPRTTAALTQETMAGQTITAFLRNPAVQKEIKVGENAICGIHTQGSIRFLVHQAHDGQQYAVVQECRAGCDAQTLAHIGIGSAAAEVEAAYGPAPRLVPRRDGATWVYPIQQLLFHLDREGRVAGWGAYRWKLE